MRPFYEFHEKLMTGYSTSILNFPVHMHGGPELVRVRSGVLKVRIHSKEYDVTDGQIAVIFPNAIHAFQTLSPEEDTLIDLIVCRHDNKNGFPAHLFGSFLNNPVLSLSHLHPDVNYLYSSLLKEITTATSLRTADTTLQSMNNNDQSVISAILQLFWLRLLPDLQVSVSQHLSTVDLPTSVITYISKHFCEPLSLEILSKELGVCRFYISRIFTHVLHTGFHEYVNTLRIDHAKKILQNTDDSILDVAIQCGFQNQQTFNRVFKEISGVTPSSYRKKY